MQKLRLLLAAISAAVSIAALAACAGDLTGPEPSTAISFDWGGDTVECRQAEYGDYLICDSSTCYRTEGSSYQCNNGCIVELGDTMGFWCSDNDDGSGGSDNNGGGSNPPPPPPSCNPEIDDCPEPPCDWETQDCADEPPDGVDPAVFEIMSDQEKQFCRAHLSECVRWAPISKIAIEWAKSEAGPAGTVDNIYDAMRHVFWSAALTRALGPDRALAWTEVHELTSDSREASCMDRHNNKLGRELAVQHPEYYSDLHLQNAAREMANAGLTKNAKFVC